MAKRNGKPELRSAQRETSPVRTLKVRESRYERVHNPLEPYKPRCCVPLIQLKGQWLDDAGFHIDSPLELHVVQKGWIILRVAPKTR